MRFSQLLIPTLKEIPHDADVVSHQLLLRAGFIRKIAQGVYAFLPLGVRVLRKLENIIREEMNRSGAQEVFMPSIIPSELWEESGRWNHYGKELLRIKDRHNKEFCYGPTHEEVITHLIKTNISSYKQLPANFYQIQTKFRDEIRPRFGLMRAREFAMKDAYSFHANTEELDQTYRVMQTTYERIFDRCGLKAKAVEADSGTIGGAVSAEFMVLANTGEDAVVDCDNCHYTANVEAAETMEAAPEKIELDPTISDVPSFCDNVQSFVAQDYKLVETPNVKSIEELCTFFKTTPDQFIKTLLYLADTKPVMILIKGDRQANEIKIKKLLNCDTLYLADEATIQSVTGAPSGYSGPINLKTTCPIYADFSVKAMKNSITGANQDSAHFSHVYPQRDFKPISYTDLRMAQEGDICPRCKKGTLSILRGIEVGHIFKLGDKYSLAMSATYLDQEGKAQYYIMGCYGIGVGRTMAAAIEQHHDEKGIIWPMALAPYTIDLILMNSKDPDLSSYADTLYQELVNQKMEVLYDDRDETAGIKFNDADLIGFPIQIIIGKKFKTEGLIEIRKRSDKISSFASKTEVMTHIQQLINNGY